MNLQNAKIAILIASIGAVIYLLFFGDLNLYVMDFMTALGFHPDPNSMDYTAADGLIRFALNSIVILTLLSIPAIVGKSLIGTTGDAEIEDNQNVSS